MAAEPARRAVVAATAATAAAAAGTLLIAGCKGLDALGPPPKPSAAVDTLTGAIAAEEQMVRACQAALAALAGQARATTLLAGVLADHRAHLASLRSRLIVPRGMTLGGRHPSQAAPSLPAGQREVVAALAAMEVAAATRLAAQLLAVPPALAQLMASIGASEAGHAALLGRPGLA